MLKLLSFAGNPNVGVYGRTTENFVFVSPTLARREVAEVEAALGVPPVAFQVGGSNILGSLVAANSHGALLPEFLLKSEARILERTGLRLFLLQGALNAAGNNVLANDKGALCNPEFPDAALSQMARVLGVPVVRGTLAGLGTVGMAGVATPRGVLVHPKATAEERETVRRALGADVYPGTINHGTGLVGAGLLANSKGAVIGSASSGIEIGRVEDALALLAAPID